MICGPVTVQAIDRLTGIADAIDVERQSQFGYGVQQKLLDFRVPLSVAPVSDPHDSSALLLVVQWSKYCSIGCFVPDVNAPGIPTLGTIDLRKGLAKNKTTIIGGRIEKAHRLGIADSPVMGVVEQQQKVGAAAAQSANGDNQLRVRP